MGGGCLTTLDLCVVPSLAKRLTNMRLLVKNIGQLVTVVEGEEVCLAGKDMGQIKVRAV